jgi:hypothetical protein
VNSILLGAPLLQLSVCGASREDLFFGCFLPGVRSR